MSVPVDRMPTAPDDMPEGSMGEVPDMPMGSPDEMPAADFSDSPTSTPQAPEGQREMMKSTVMIAMQVLEKALPVFGSMTPEGKAVMDSLKPLAKTFGQAREGDLTTTQIMNMMSQLPTEMQNAAQQAAASEGNLPPVGMGAQAPPAGIPAPPLGSVGM